MCRDGRARVDDRVSKGSRVVALSGVNPHCGKTKSRILRAQTLQFTVHYTGVDREFTRRLHFSTADHHPVHHDLVGLGTQIEVVADVNLRDQESELIGQFLADPTDAGDE